VLREFSEAPEYQEKLQVFMAGVVHDLRLRSEWQEVGEYVVDFLLACGCPPRVEYLCERCPMYRHQGEFVVSQVIVKMRLRAEQAPRYLVGV